MWVVYILECKYMLFYTGVTNDLQNRLEKHNDGKGAKFTRNYKPCKIVWHEHHKNRSEAQCREHEIKGWGRKKKIELIRDSSLCSECS